MLAESRGIRTLDLATLDALFIPLQIDVQAVWPAATRSFIISVASVASYANVAIISFARCTKRAVPADDEGCTLYWSISLEHCGTSPDYLLLPHLAGFALSQV